MIKPKNIDHYSIFEETIYNIFEALDNHDEHKILEYTNILSKQINELLTDCYLQKMDLFFLKFFIKLGISQEKNINSFKNQNENLNFEKRILWKLKAILPEIENEKLPILLSIISDIWSIKYYLQENPETFQKNINLIECMINLKLQKLKTP